MSNIEYLPRTLNRLKENKKLLDDEIKQINDFLAIRADIIEIFESWQEKQINKRLADKIHALNNRLYLSKQPYSEGKWQLNFYRESGFCDTLTIFSYLKLPDKMDGETLEKIKNAIIGAATYNIDKKNKIQANFKKAPAKIKKLCLLADEINKILDELDSDTKKAAGIKLSTLFV